MAAHFATHSPLPPSVLWLCPHRDLDLTTTHKILSAISPNSTAPFLYCPPSSCHQNLTTIVETLSTSPPTYTLRTFISLTPATGLKSLHPLLNKSLIRLLQPHLDIPICAHLTLSSSSLVAHIYNITPPSPSSRPINSTCPDCHAAHVNTSAAFVSIPNPNSSAPSPPPAIAIELVRTLGPLTNPADAHWAIYALPHSQMDLIAGKWEAWVAKRASLFDSWCQGDAPPHHSTSVPQTAPASTSPPRSPPGEGSMTRSLADEDALTETRDPIPSLGLSRWARMKAWVGKLNFKHRGGRLFARRLFAGFSRPAALVMEGEMAGDGYDEDEGRALLRREEEGEDEGVDEGEDEEAEHEVKEGREEEKQQQQQPKDPQKKQQKKKSPQKQQRQREHAAPKPTLWTASIPGLGMIVS